MLFDTVFLPALRAALILILWCLLRAVRPLAVSGTLRVWLPGPRVLVVLRSPAPVIVTTPLTDVLTVTETLFPVSFFFVIAILGPQPVISIWVFGLGRSEDLMADSVRSFGRGHPETVSNRSR